MTVRTLLCGGTLLAVGACAGSQLESDAVLSGDPWRLEGPELRIGAVDDPDFAFREVVAMAEAPDGVLYSVHFGESSVRRWTPDGRPAGTIGRAGQGPGEFTTPRQVGFFGDSVWVMDTGTYRASYFDLEGEFLGSVSPTVDLGGRETLPPRPVRPLRDGTFYGETPARSDWLATGRLTETPAVLMEATGAIIADVWTHPREPRDLLALLNEDGSGGSFGLQPFGDAVLSALTDRGLVVVDRRAWTGEGPAVMGVTVIAFTGDTVASATLDYEPVPLPAARVDSVASARAAEMYGFMSEFRPGLVLGALEEDYRDAMYRPEYLPPVSDLSIARDGSIWLERFPVGEPYTEWWVLDADAQPMGHALVPAGLDVHLIETDHVWGVESDELDVEYVVRYRLLRTT